MTQYERRYPRTPYPPRSEATRLYRDGWDLGWRHMGTIGLERTRDHYEGMPVGPSKHGYHDGVLAWVERQVKARENDDLWREKAARDQREWEARHLLEGRPT